MKTIVEKIVEKVLTTTNDTYHVLISSINNLPLKDRNSVLKELERSFFELSKEYIIPHFENKALQFKEEEFINWLIYKEMEVNDILTIRGINRNPIEKQKSFQSIYVDLNFNQSIKLFEFLITNNYISNKTKFDTLLKVFSGKTFNEQHKIIWERGITLFNYFIHFLEIYGFYTINTDEISGRITKNYLFINSKNNNPFDNLRSRNDEIKDGIAYYEKRNTIYRKTLGDGINDMKNYKEIKELDVFIKNLKHIK
mgnify:CR=1 FL=1